MALDKPQVDSPLRRHRGRLIAGVVVILLGGLAVVGGLYFWAGYQYRAGLQALQERRLADARDHFDTALKIRPNDPDLRLFAGRACRMLRDFDEAEKHLKTCKQLEGNRPSEVVTLEWALLQAQEGYLNDTEEYLVNYYKKHPSSGPLVMEAMAQGYLAMFRVTPALSAVKYWLEMEPNNADAYYWQGRAWRRVHNTNQSAASFKKAVELDPENDDARLLWAADLLETGQIKDALPHLEYLRKRQPDDPSILITLASAQNTLGKTDDALATLEDILARHPDFAPAWTARGQMAIQDGKSAEAEKYLRKALDYAPYDRLGHYLLFQSLQNQGKSTEAEAQHIRLNTIEAKIIRMNQISNTEIEKNPNDPALHYEMGCIYLDLGHEKVGLRWLHSALALNPKYAPVHRRLAEYYEKQGQTGPAEFHRRQAGDQKEMASR